MAAPHVEALAWLRFGRRMPIVCTEGGNYNADVLGLTATTAVEVEVKVSIADLRAEFRDKQAKHHMYGLTGEGTTLGNWAPNYFYFFVTEEIYEKALPIIEELAPKAGVARLRYPAKRPMALGHGVEVGKRAKKLHDKAPSTRLLRAALMRMSSEICVTRAALENVKGGELTPDLFKHIMETTERLQAVRDWEADAPELEPQILKALKD